MKRWPVIFFLIAIGFVLFLICISVWGTKDLEFFGGLLLLYSGTIVLISSILQKESSLYGLRFRGILAGIGGIIIGLVAIIRFFT